MAGIAALVLRDRLQTINVDLLGSTGPDFDSLWGKVGDEAELAHENLVKAFLNRLDLLISFRKSSLQHQTNEFLNSGLGHLALLTIFTELNFVTI